jgi:hypothetical protein
MTNREFFEKIAKNETLAEEIRNHATEAIAKLDKRNADRQAKPSKTALENAPIKVAILEYLVGKSEEVASVIAENVGISTSKASALCGQLVAEEKIVATEVKIKGKGKVKGYTLAVADEVEPTDEAE